MASWREALVTVAATTLALGAAGPAGAQEPAAVGWWWVGRPAAMFPALLSPDPAPPDGGLYVAGGAAGAWGISALRFQVAPDATATTLTLRIAEASGVLIIDACPAAESWEAAENGGWDQRPEPDCETASVTGTVNGDQTAMTFTLFNLPHDGALDLVLVPGEDPETGSPARFSVALEAPAGDALAVSEPGGTDASGAANLPGAATPAAPAARPTKNFVVPSGAPAPLTEVPVPAESETPSPSVAGSGQPTALASGSRVPEGFAYPAVLALPLVLLIAGSFLGWSLTRPVTVRSGRAP